MAELASQVVAQWLYDDLPTEWEALDSAVERVLVDRMSGKSREEVQELVEEHVAYVEKHLRDSSNQHLVDGTECSFEIDDNRPPYIRLSKSYDVGQYRALKALKSKEFEELCGRILDTLGCKAQVVGATDDGGVDFVAFNLRFSTDVPAPQSSLLAVIGQAKHVTKSIRESEVRRFVGGAMRKLHQYRKAGQIHFASPVVLAFWTTSDFHEDAAEYARALGIWFMSGRSLARYAFDKKLLALSPRAPTPTPSPPEDGRVSRLVDALSGQPSTSIEQPVGIMGRSQTAADAGPVQEGSSVGVVLPNGEPSTEGSGSGP